MTPEQFAYWLQGFFETSGATTLDKRQVRIVKDHLQFVFTKVTPTRRPSRQPKKPIEPTYCSPIRLC